MSNALKTPLALDVEIETPTTTYRLAADDPDPEKRPQSLGFSCQRGDGFGPASLTLSRNIFRDYPDLNLLDTWRFVSRSGDVAWEGKLHSMPRTNDPNQQISISLVGWATYLKSRKISPLIIDARLNSWTGASTSRKAFLIDAQRRLIDPSVGWQGNGTSPPGVVADFTGVTTSVGKYDRMEAWFWGGGETIGRLLYHFTNIKGAGNVSVWGTQAYLCTDDIASAFEGYVDHDGFTNGNKYETFPAKSGGYKYGLFVSERFDNSGGLALPDLQNWEFPKAIGSHGLEVSGSWPEVGFRLSEVMEYIINTYYPKLTWAGEKNSFIVQQCAYHDNPTDGYEILFDINQLALWEFGVYEDKKVHFRPADLTKADWVIRTDEPGVSASFEGDSIENFANGVSVTYTDFSGINQVLWPDKFPELTDDNPNNPANTHGENLWTDYQVPTPCSEGEAIQYGRAYLAEFNRAKRPGTFTINGGYIKDAAGNWQPGWKVRDGDTIVVQNHPDEEPRLIFASDWDSESRTITITVDGTPQYLEAIVARQELSRTARGLT